MPAEGLTAPARELSCAEAENSKCIASAGTLLAALGEADMNRRRTALLIEGLRRTDLRGEAQTRL